MHVSPGRLLEKEAFLRHLLPTMIVQKPRCTSFPEVKTNVMMSEVSRFSDEDKKETSEDDIASAHLWTIINVTSVPSKPPLFAFFCTVPSKQFTVSSPAELFEYVGAFLQDELVLVVVYEINRKQFCVIPCLELYHTLPKLSWSNNTLLACAPNVMVTKICIYIIYSFCNFC